MSPLKGVSGGYEHETHISRAPTVTELEVTPILKNPTYYIPSGDVVLLVGAQLFRVHRYFFERESETFRAMLADSRNPSEEDAGAGEAFGSSDSCAIPLSNVSVEEFESFLNLFYNEIYEYDTSDITSWTAILRLAHMWSFSKIKALAIRMLDRLEVAPIEKAVMAREYNVDPSYRWLEHAYAALGSREAPISKDEGARLGLDVVVSLIELRERIKGRRYEKEKKLREESLARELEEGGPCPKTSGEESVPEEGIPEEGIRVAEEAIPEVPPAPAPAPEPVAPAYVFHPPLSVVGPPPVAPFGDPAIQGSCLSSGAANPGPPADEEPVETWGKGKKKGGKGKKKK